MAPSGEKRKVRSLSAVEEDFEHARELSICPQKVLDEMRNQIDHESSELDVVARFLNEARERVARKRTKLAEAKERPMMLCKFAELQREWFDHPETVKQRFASTPENLEQTRDIPPPPPDEWLGLTYDEANALVRQYVADHKLVAAAMVWRMPGSRERAQVLRLSSADDVVQIFVRYTLLDVAAGDDSEASDDLALTHQTPVEDLTWQTDLVVQIDGICVRKIVDVGWSRKTHDVSVCRGDVALLSPNLVARIPGAQSAPDDHYRFLRALMSIFSYLMLARGFWLVGPQEFVAARGFPTPFDSRP